MTNSDNLDSEGLDPMQRSTNTFFGLRVTRLPPARRHLVRLKSDVPPDFKNAALKVFKDQRKRDSVGGVLRQTETSDGVLRQKNTLTDGVYHIIEHTPKIVPRQKGAETPLEGARISGRPDVAPGQGSQNLNGPSIPFRRSEPGTSAEDSL